MVGDHCVQRERGIYVIARMIATAVGAQGDYGRLWWEMFEYGKRWLHTVREKVQTVLTVLEFASRINDAVPLAVMCWSCVPVLEPSASFIKALSTSK